MTRNDMAEAGKSPAHDALTGYGNGTGVDLSICIPYYDEIDYLCHCLRSLPFPIPGYRCEIIVIDDASDEPCAERIRTEFPNVRVIENKANMGFAAAINRAVRASTGRYLLLLNSDTKVLDGLPEVIAFLEESPDVGAAGPRVLNPDGSFQPQCRRGRLTPASAFGYVTRLDRRFPTGKLGEYLERWRSELEQQDVAALSGACMIVRRDVFESMGGFDETFIMYGEDLDLCYRIGEVGRRVVYFPRANVIHAGGCGGTRRRYYRSRLLFWRGAWMVLTRDRSTRGATASDWLLGIAASMGFLGSCLVSPFRFLGVGARKSVSELAPEAWPRVVPTLSPGNSEADS